MLRQRSRDLYMGSPLATGALKTFRTNVVGFGLRLKAQVDVARGKPCSHGCIAVNPATKARNSVLLQVRRVKLGRAHADTPAGPVSADKYYQLLGIAQFWRGRVDADVHSRKYLYPITQRHIGIAADNNFFQPGAGVFDCVYHIDQATVGGVRRHGVRSFNSELVRVPAIFKPFVNFTLGKDSRNHLLNSVRRSFSPVPGNRITNQCSLCIQRQIRLIKINVKLPSK